MCHGLPFRLLYGESDQTSEAGRTKMKRKKKSGKSKPKSAPRRRPHAVHPGQILQDKFLNPRKMTQAALTEKLGWKLTRLNKLINGKGGVTASSAIDLSRALRTK